MNELIPKKEPKKMFAMWLEKETHDQIKKIAEKKNRSMSDVVRILIDKMLESLKQNGLSSN